MCPVGYLAMDGDVAGGGLIGGYSASLETCKNDCDARVDCNSFTHSTSANSCKLLAESAPTSAKFEDYQFCTKNTGTSLYEW